MKKHTVSIVASLMLLSGLASAQGLGSTRFWKDHEEAKAQLIHAWLTEAEPKVFANALYRLGRSEAYLIQQNARVVSDSRMVMQLANTDGFRMKTQYDWPRFGYRVFMHEVNRRLDQGLSVEHLFRNRRFDIEEK